MTQGSAWDGPGLVQDNAGITSQRRIIGWGSRDNSGIILGWSRDGSRISLGWSRVGLG